MYNLSQHLHFIGIGGVGMAGIAEVLLNLGYTVSGSDLKESSLTRELRQLGATIHLGHRAENLAPSVTTVVVSSAIHPQNPELLKAAEKGLPVIQRAEMLAELMRMKYGVAVAGSHGKTTTTSMAAKLLRDVGFDPTVIIGGRVLTQSTGALLGASQYLVAEADESDGSFNLLRPAIAVVTNIDREHMTHYGSDETLNAAFRGFAESVPFYGLVIFCAEDPRASSALQGISRRTMTYGFSDDFDLSAHEIRHDGPITTYMLKVGKSVIGEVRLPMIGRHLVLNSLAAIGVALELGAYPEEAIKSLEEFPGVARRTERVGENNGVLVLDDYGHHPSEVAATITAVRRSWLPYQAKRYGRSTTGKLHVLFEPHRYSRTRELFDEFLSAFDEADRVVIGDIYAAGEEAIVGTNGERLAAALKHPAAIYMPDLNDAAERLIGDLEEGDVVLTLGAGAIGRVAQMLVELLKQTELAA